MDIRGLLLICVVSGFMVMCGGVKAEEMRKTCYSNKAEIKRIGDDLTKVIFSTWRKAGNLTDPQRLWAEAEYSAYWILRDNNIVCKGRK